MIIGHRLNRFTMPTRIFGILALLLWLSCSSCASSQAQAEERLFLPLTVEFLDEYILPASDYDGTTVGGLSAIAYDRQQDLLYALSDDRGNFASPRFYTLRLHATEDTKSSNNLEFASSLENGASNTEPNFVISSIDIEAVTTLTQENGDAFPTDTIDPEGLVLSPNRTLFIASEGVTSERLAPWVDEFDLSTGQRLRRLPIPRQYQPAAPAEAASENPNTSQADSSINSPPIGVQNNKGFEALALSASGMGVGNDEPFRVFAGLENPLIQDSDIVATEALQPGRIIHYVVSPDRAFILAEHVYPIDPLPFGAVTTGLVELLALGPSGDFLSLERSYGLGGTRAKLFQTTFADATDTISLLRLAPNAVPASEGVLADDSPQAWLDGIQPMRKKLVLDLYDLGITLDNLEGMTLGPRLSDGSQSLLLMSDNNFNSDEQVTQFLLFRIKGLPPML